MGDVAPRAHGVAALSGNELVREGRGVQMKFLESFKLRWVVWVWNHTPNCAEMARLTSRSLEQPLTLRLRARMWLHFLICAWCKRYFKHLKFLHRTAPRFNERVAGLPGRGLSPEARRRITQRLQAVHRE